MSMVWLMLQVLLHIPELRADVAGNAPWWTQRLTPQRMAALVSSHNFAAMLAQLQVQAAQAAVLSSGAVNNPLMGTSVGPSWGFNVSQCAATGCTKTQITGLLNDQGSSFDVILGKRQKRLRVAEAALKAAKLSQQDQLRQLIFAAKLQVLTVAIDLYQQHYARATAQSLQQTLVLFAKRLQVGDVRKTEALRLEMLQAQAENAANLAEMQSESDSLDLALMLGAPGPMPKLMVDQAWLEDTDTAPYLDQDSNWLAQALQNRPDVAAMAAQMERARANQHLSRSNLLPYVEAFGAYQGEGTGNSAIQPPTLGIGINFSLPIAYQYQGEQAAANTDFQAQNVQQRFLLAQVHCDLQKDQLMLQQAWTRLGNHRQRIIPTARGSRDLIKRQYLQGSASLLDYLDAERSLLAVYNDYMQGLTDFWQAYWQFEVDSGAMQ